MQLLLHSHVIDKWLLVRSQRTAPSRGHHRSHLLLQHGRLRMQDPSKLPGKGGSPGLFPPSNWLASRQPVRQIVIDISVARVSVENSGNHCSRSSAVQHGCSPQMLQVRCTCKLLTAQQQ